MASVNKQLKKVIGETPLEELVDVEILQGLQERFADTTGISVIIRDLKGRPVSKPSCQNSFCRMISATGYG